MTVRCILPFLLVFAFQRCTSTGSGDGKDGPTFQALLNLSDQPGPLKRIDLDYTDAIDSGFVIPGRRQIPGGSFTLSVRSSDAPIGRYAYKVYYMNDSYRFPHASEDGSQHPLAHENFYGSWWRPDEGFRWAEATEDGGLVIIDSLRIRADPRQEPQFVDDLGRHSSRSRNPRVGEYKFMLVLMPEATYSTLTIPEAVLDLGAKEQGRYVDPFWFWLHGPGASTKGAEVVLADERLAVRARPDLGAGIYVPHDAPGDSSAYTSLCGRSEEVRRRAAFHQFIHYVDASTAFDNIPLIADVQGGAYSPEDHDRYRALFPRDQLVRLRPMTTRTPCATVISDPVGKRVMMWNPASTYEDLRKENVGIRALHGLTYGRFRVKCKLTRLLSEEDMWVGLTNAIWLINDEARGLMRRPCTKDGYMSSYYGGNKDERVPQVAYSEIDFEILKTPPYCPDRSFPPPYPQQLPLPEDRNAWIHSRNETRTDGQGMITVACTNWDMACHSPPGFDVGCHDIHKDGRTFTNHRWDHDYRALTQKIEAPESELFGGDHYWFEIEWRPREITWRIGPDLEHMRVVGYMNDSITEITNVQMQLIVTQEFHNTRWWPGTPYDQGFIPFPEKDLVGEVLDVIID